MEFVTGPPSRWFVTLKSGAVDPETGGDGGV
jgi:hypothetical protein